MHEAKGDKEPKNTVFLGVTKGERDGGEQMKCTERDV